MFYTFRMEDFIEDNQTCHCYAVMCNDDNECIWCRKDTDNSTVKITLSEVAHSIFYAPQYVSIEFDILKMRALTLILSQALVLIR